MSIEDLNSSKKQVNIEKESYEGNMVLLLKGSIDTYNSNDIGKTVLEEINTEAPGVLIIDLSGVNYVASTGIGCMTMILKHCDKKGVRLYLAKISPKVLEVFSLLGFTSFFTIITDYNEIFDKDDAKYPMNTECPNCGTKVKIPKVGRFKCKSCGSIIVAEENGEISLGGI